MRRAALALAAAALAAAALAVWLRGAAALDLNPPQASALVLDRWGNPLLESLSGDESYCRPLGIEDIGKPLVLATLAAEDRRFWDHGGVDWRATARAAWQDLRARRVVSGASTLAMQTSRLLSPHAKGIFGKLWEARQALALVRRHGHERVLEAYLNMAPYGGMVRGASAASDLYFNTSPMGLSIAQAAYLAAIPQNPTRFDPLRNPETVLPRQRRVLRAMARQGWINGDQLGRALAEPVRVRRAGKAYAAPHFVRRLPRASGGEVRTALDGPLQKDLQALVKSHVAGLKGHAVGNAALVVLDNADMSVLAWVGSADFGDAARQGQVDGVSALRQPGSALKPFLYGLAFTQGMNPTDIILDEPLAMRQGFVPKNYDERYHGPVPLKRALACSYNVPAVRLAERVGVARYLALLRKAGFQSLDRDAAHYGTGLALGNGEVTLLELAAAYAGLANGGVWRAPRLVMDAPQGRPSRFLSPQATYLVLDALSDPAARAPAFGWNSPLRQAFPFAAKTGTSKDYRDNWAVGCCRGFTVAVWAGNFDGAPMQRVSGITGAGPLLHDAVLRVARSRDPGVFARPAGLVTDRVCPATGLLAAPGCPHRVEQVFIAGQAPARYCGRDHSRGDQDEEDAAAAKGRRRIEMPNHGAVFRINPSVDRASQSIRLRATLPGGRALRWAVDGHDVPLENGKAWWTLEPGEHLAQVWDAESPTPAARARFTVLP